MKKADYLALATELEVNVTEENTVDQIKLALCDALIDERAANEEEVAGLTAALATAGKTIEAKATVVSVGKKDYRFIGGKHNFKGQMIDADLLNKDADLAKECVDFGVGFLIEL